MSELIDLTERLLKFSLANGADEAEIFGVKEKRISIHQTGETVNANTNVTAGIGIRVALGKKWGFTSSSSLDLKNAETEVKEVIKIAKLREIDPDFYGFPSSGSIPSFRTDLKEIRNIQIEEVITSLVDARDKAMALDRNLSNVQGGFQFVIGERAIANSSGLNFSYERGSYSTSFSAVGSYGNNRFSENSFKGGTEFNYDFDKLALDAAQRTVDMFRPSTSVKSGSMDLLMEPFAAAIFFIGISRLMFKGNLALSNRSILTKDHLGTQVASKEFTFIDDGLYKGGIKSAPIDDEGSPSSTTPLIKNGILENFLYDYSSARKAGQNSTGNAMRGIGHSARSYTALPQIGSRDRIIKTGSKSQLELIESIDRGILIGYPAGIFLGNPMTNDFTIFPTRVLEISNGEVVGPVSGVSMAGNGLTWLKKISAVGNDSVMMESVVSPSVVFSDIEVNSKGKIKPAMPKMPPSMG